MSSLARPNNSRFRCPERTPTAAARRKELDRALEILWHLVPDRNPLASRSDAHLVVFDDLAPPQQDFVIREFCRRRLEMAAQNLGKIESYPIGAPPPGYDASKPETDTRLKWRIKCVSSPSLSDECYDAFDCVGIDEGVKIKGEETFVGQGVRQMDPPFRLIASATPIKNRLGDIFRLAWWAAGGRPEAHARFPYRDDTTERASFEQTFLGGAEITGYDSEGKAKPARSKVTAEVCNIHRLWKLFGPLIARRRVENCGEDLPECVRKVYRCQLGTEQARVVQYHIDACYLDRNDLPAIGAHPRGRRPPRPARWRHQPDGARRSPASSSAGPSPARTSPSSSPASSAWPRVTALTSARTSSSDEWLTKWLTR